MPIEMALWKIDKDGQLAPLTEGLTKLASSKFADELRLEKLLVHQLDEVPAHI